MELKQHHVIKPGSIHVHQEFHLKVGNKNSPFSNGYDMPRAAESLGNKVFEAVSEEDPQFTEWEVFKAHELLLKNYLGRNNKRKGNLVWGTYEILPSENDRFSKIGNLTSSSSDKFLLHTKQGVRMWEGNNNRRNGARWPGIKYGLSLSGELFSAAMADNPYAQYHLCNLEEQIQEINVYIHDAQDDVDKQIQELASSGLSISIVRNDDPVEVSLMNTRGYGFKLVKMLMDYDQFVCAVKTLTTKGMMSNKQGNDILYNGSRLMRRTLNYLYTVVMEIRSIRNIRRDSLFDDATRAKLKMATEQGALPHLPMSLWMYDKQPSLVYIQKKMKPDELQKLAAVLKEEGLAE